MSIDALVANDGRLRILTALAADGAQEFVRLRRSTRLTDGNLSAHARRLQAAGLVDIEKAFREGKPVTTFHLSPVGRQRLTAHVRALVEAVMPGEQRQPELVAVAADDAADDWID
ncbi:MAG TPA: transcriptional regulator [Tepidisphaeraceae bacterium]|nr:transcriptional regulator [Tepidisphaeraceae bacterium]